MMRAYSTRRKWAASYYLWHLNHFIWFITEVKNHCVPLEKAEGPNQAVKDKAIRFTTSIPKRK